MKKAISVIIPCYNCENYIGKTIKSIIEQTFKDFEIIIVNDESKDKSVAISESILKNNNISFKIINQKNGGVSKARNTGLEHCDGKYVYMIDSDDFIENNFFEEMYRRLESDELDMIFSGHDRVDEKGNISFKYDNRYEYINHILEGKDVIHKVLKNKMLLWTGCVIYKKELLDKYNIRYNEMCSNGEDQEFWIKALVHSKKVSSVNRILAHYLQRGTSITHSPSLKRFTSLGAVMRIKKYFIENEIDKSDIQLIESYKYQKEFIYNFSSIALECKDIKYLGPIIKSCGIKSKLRAFKVQSFSIYDMKNFLAIKAYLFNPKLYAKILNKYVSKNGR